MCGPTTTFRRIPSWGADQIRRGTTAGCIKAFRVCYNPKEQSDIHCDDKDNNLL
jgi:hypothetical protein